MISRNVFSKIKKALARQAAVAIIGPRQVGKTTIAFEIIQENAGIYLDLESSSDRAKLNDVDLYFNHHADKMIVLDEIHQMPNIFMNLRGIIDQRRRDNKKYGQFLLLGSAALDLLRQSGESLAGRIEYIEMHPFNALEIDTTTEDKTSVTSLWLKGGFPESYLTTIEDSYAFRLNFIKTYLQRDIPQYGMRIPANTLERFWKMLAHSQSSIFNASKIASSLSISSPTATNYLDLLVDLLLVRRLAPYRANINKRLVKSPKIYIRDSGILHSLLGIKTYDDLISNPVAGSSFEGFVIENILSVVPEGTQASYYRTSNGAEIDLVLELPNNNGLWAIEVKLGLAPKVSKGFYSSLADLNPKKAYIVYSGEENYPLGENIEVISLRDLMKLLSQL